MKTTFRYIQFVIFLALMPTVFAQNSSGVVKYTITSNWRKMMANNKAISQESKDRSAYVWGSGDSEDESYAELKFNSRACRFEFLPDEEEELYRRTDDDAYIIYRNREENQTFDYQNFMGKLYVIEDSISCQNWKIGHGMKEIAGHICIDAYCYDTIKEKEIVAWFALDLPMLIGPDRYCGLPGMILEVNESNGALVYTATTLLFSDEEMPIDKPTYKKKTKFITHTQYEEMIFKQVSDSKKQGRPYFWSIGY
jgi:GLPGLI family protein